MGVFTVLTVGNQQSVINIHNVDGLFMALKTLHYDFLAIPALHHLREFAIPCQ